MKRHYHWVIAAAALFTLFVSNGLIIGGLSVFDEELLRTFGWTRGALKFRDLITLAIAGLVGPFVGALADRFGVRPLMAVGAVLLSASMFLYARIDSLNHMYGIHVLFAVVLASCGLI
ncbi:MAG: MFS transporter, partial [Acidobacteria bacterium]|nr:MFS transporter [Acidobacteriota bacterium]